MIRKLIKKLLLPIVREAVKEEMEKKQELTGDLVLSELSRCLKGSSLQ